MFKTNLINGKQVCKFVFLGDPLPGYRKQCWCEPNEKLPPFHIAVEGNGKIDEF
jgi:hypothetical protein|tara:strand:+ start:994 stop:1155 length:162 start_codon:yes stop_codon:yes gene_type:complete